jgi:hypothetical protein
MSDVAMLRWLSVCLILDRPCPLGVIIGQIFPSLPVLLSLPHCFGYKLTFPSPAQGCTESTMAPKSAVAATDGALSAI